MIFKKNAVYRYEVNFQKGLSCGGAYIKLLTSGENLEKVRRVSNAMYIRLLHRCGYVYLVS